MNMPTSFQRPQPDSLADVLERVLDKGIVIAGDIVVNVLDLELLSLKLRLFVSSAETAREMGLDWWTRDPFFNSRLADERSDQRSLRQENDELRARIEELERLTLDHGRTENAADTTEDAVTRDRGGAGR